MVSFIIILSLIILTICALLFIEIYNVSKFCDIEIDIDDIKFDKCIVPYKR